MAKLLVYDAVFTPRIIEIERCPKCEESVEEEMDVEDHAVMYVWSKSAYLSSDYSSGDVIAPVGDGFDWDGSGWRTTMIQHCDCGGVLAEGAMVDEEVVRP